MYAGWNLVITLICISFCGQSLGLWPFDVLASKDVPDNDYEASNAKCIAIIGMSTLLFSSIFHEV